MHINLIYSKTMDFSMIDGVFDNNIDLRIGDCRELIHEIPNESIDCVMTSPSRWKLRDDKHFNQIGWEEKPDYIKGLVNFFGIIKDKLNKSGNCFINMDDTYGTQHIDETESDIIKYKCLNMIPERFAIGMIDDGWILRNKIVWYRENHKPESVKDRLTNSYEIIYHFVKSESYFYDLDAIRIPRKHPIEKPKPYNGKFAQEDSIEPETASSLRARTQRYTMEEQIEKYNEAVQKSYNQIGKNPTDGWNINTTPYPDAHFSVYPLELVERPIIAGCPRYGTVLDPFAGSGTTGEFCADNDRHCILFEINPDYAPMIKKRTHAIKPSLFSFCTA